jgi:tRNA-specific 2-thiouridylase
MPKKTVFVGMSGGVDSSVAAALLKQQGFNVVGIFMKNWSDDEYGLCTTEGDFADVRAVCHKLDIPYYTFNFEKEYKDKVLSYFFTEYKAGRTPNPDIMCNSEIKFGLFYDKAMAMGADFVATGHYANIGKRKGEWRLLRAKDAFKDQTYFLYRIDPKQFPHLLFPIGGYLKNEVRALAKRFKLPTQNKPDSQGICFVGEIDVTELIKSHIPAKTGEIVELASKAVIGSHEGAHLFTIGQRHNLGLGGLASPLYVIKTDVRHNRVFVGPDSLLMHREAILTDWHTLVPASFKLGKLEAKIRHTPNSYPGRLERTAGKMRFIFDQPVRAVTPGQSLVAYDGDIVIGGGVIAEAVL